VENLNRYCGKAEENPETGQAFPKRKPGRKPFGKQATASFL